MITYFFFSAIKCQYWRTNHKKFNRGWCRVNKDQFHVITLLYWVIHWYFINKSNNLVLYYWWDKKC